MPIGREGLAGVRQLRLPSLRRWRHSFCLGMIEAGLDSWGRFGTLELAKSLLIVKVAPK
jgi:hypothetical protein